MTQNAINNNYFCSASLSADLTANGITTKFTAHDNQTFGDAVYMLGTGKVGIADASAIATSAVIGLCVSETVSADAVGEYLLFGIIRRDAWNWSAPGVLLYLSLTGTATNTISETLISGTDECVVVLGTAIDDDHMLFMPNLAIVEHT